MLIPDWKRVLRKSWAIRLILLAGFLSGLEIALPFLEGWLQTRFHIPKWVYPVLMSLVTCGAVIARLMAQPKMYSRSKKDGD